MAFDPRKSAGLVLFLAAFQFSMCLILAEALYGPGYSASLNVISDLGIGPSAWLFNPSIIILGALLIGAAAVGRKLFGRVLVVFLTLSGAGAIGVGTFTLNTGIFHQVAAVIAFLFAGLSAAWTSRLVRPPFAYVSVAAGAISLVALGLFISGTYLGLGKGGMERMIVYPIIGWAAAFGGALMAAEQPPGPTA